MLKENLQEPPLDVGEIIDSLVEIKNRTTNPCEMLETINIARDFIEMINV